ncbi:MAG: hypothetical protein AB1921_00985 [Thermodesulfobacteriota bacterium]
MSLEQINLSYVPMEDRMLLAATGRVASGLAEYRVWLTRRYVRLLWGALEKLVSESSAADPRVPEPARAAVREFAEQAALSSADFSTPYTPQVTERPLGEAPLLVSRIQLKNLPDGKNVLALHDQQGKGLTMTLEIPVVHSLRKLLHDTAEKAEWNLGLSLYAQAAAPVGPKPTVN